MFNTFDPLSGNEPDDASQPPKKSDAKKAAATSRRALTFFFVGFVLVVGLAIVVSQYVEKPVATIASTNQNSRTPAKVTPTPDGVLKVYITGEVASPGVYSVQPGDRVIDVVNVAGGFTGNADQRRVEQAVRVKDEMRIDIPKLPATSDPAAPLPAQNQNANLPPANISTPSATNSPLPNVNNSGKINVNTASAADLDKLPGIGAVLSQRIIEYRTKNGPFQNLDDLRKVEGLSKSVADKLKDLIEF